MVPVDPAGTCPSSERTGRANVILSSSTNAAVRVGAGLLVRFVRLPTKISDLGI